ncbi:unnamed protein product [Lactuca virosa]|uniref:Protein kinase domain-containing protein n=1 Tax=Lactuca virosa TaxID=75947 RepID=A0AAU9LYB6_9ASTR|nr:unnamed protein product [Lactuca virosa]
MTNTCDQGDNDDLLLYIIHVSELNVESPIPSKYEHPSEPDPELDVPIAIMKGERSCTYPISSFVSYGKLSSTSRTIISTLDNITIHQTVGEALNHSRWRDVMIDEINSLDQNNTWDLVDLPAMVYLDDIVITGSDEIEIKKLKDFPSSRFQTKNLGPIKYFWGIKVSDLRGLDLQTGAFTYRQIKAATDKFADSNKLGEGGFGSVYMGTLLDGTPIAVKKLSSKSKQGNREFVNEIGMIAGIQHPNVVRLYGCCVEGNHLLLVYEYMENNSLAHALFEHNNSKLESDWPTRQRVCVGIAKGLTFLHEDSVLKMVHRDIKASNVLLNADLTPKISDFGLAKLDEEKNTHITTRVAGTIGYMAPEYALWGYLTYKADVYSFGVLALEIVAGENNIKYRPTEDYFCLLDWAVVLKQKGSLIDLVDPRLGSGFNKKEAVRMIKIALLCTNKSPALRPTMSEVVNMLEGRMKIKEPNMKVTLSEEELVIGEIGGTIKEMKPHESVQTVISIEATASSSNSRPVSQ